MNVSEWRELGEALDMWARFGPNGTPRRHLVNLAAAARQTLDRYQECDACEDGFVDVPSPADMSLENLGRVELWTACPSCGVSGLLPNQARLEAAWEAYGNELNMSAAVRAFDEDTDNA